MIINVICVKTIKSIEDTLIDSSGGRKSMSVNEMYYEKCSKCLQGIIHC